MSSHIVLLQSVDGQEHAYVALVPLDWEGNFNEVFYQTRDEVVSADPDGWNMDSLADALFKKEKIRVVTPEIGPFWD